MKLATLDGQNVAKPEGRQPNNFYRVREWLTEEEVGLLMKSAKKTGRYGHRDATMILLAFRHGLRVSELVSLHWQQIDLKAGTIYVLRSKGGSSCTHPLTGEEIRALRRLKDGAQRYVFMTERGSPMTTSSFQKIVERASEDADLGIKVHPHMLRHSTGYKLANDGHDTRSIQHYFGHSNIQNTVRYTALAPGRFNGFFTD
jgi:site-specific recombinase XerD